LVDAGYVHGGGGSAIADGAEVREVVVAIVVDPVGLLVGFSVSGAGNGKKFVGLSVSIFVLSTGATAGAIEGAIPTVGGREGALLVDGAVVDDGITLMVGREVGAGLTTHGSAFAALESSKLHLSSTASIHSGLKDLNCCKFSKDEAKLHIFPLLLDI
jgi:hypothetical protein